MNATRWTRGEDARTKSAVRLAAWGGAALFMLAGCQASGQFEDSLDHRTIVEDVATPHHGELMYVEDNAELLSRLKGSELVLRPEQPFMGVMLNFSAESLPAMSYAVERLDGSLNAYEPLKFDHPESEQADAHVALIAMAGALRLRFDGAPTGVEFIRASFVITAEPEGDIELDDDWDPARDVDGEELSEDVVRLELSKAGRYVPPSGVVDAGRQQRVGYDGAPAWRGQSGCSGTFRSGTRKLGDFLKQNFPGARSYGGYSCRRNTANTSRTSVHGTGRAIDVFVPLHNGQADNDLGDPIANWLIENAEAIGVQFIVWDRTSWGASRSGDKHRRYSGPHPHHDHLHIELDLEGAAERRPWFSGGAVTPPGGAVSCPSRTLGRSVPAGECVQMPYDSCGGSGTCLWAKCTDQGAWSCTDLSQCGGAQHASSSCAPPPEPEPEPEPEPAPPAGDSCPSRTLGRDVAHGDCVQMNYNSCGGSGSCLWAECADGAWLCKPKSSCEHGTFGHSDCAAPEPSGESCWSNTLGREVPDSQWVQMSHSACGGTCRWAHCEDGTWMCGQPSGGVQHAHRSCR